MSHDREPSDLPELGIVIISRNEAAHISRCIEAALDAARRYADTSIVLIDSDSSDDTVKIASQYPISICQYDGPTRSAAAGRRIGAERIHARRVLFLDGDCLLMPEWLPEAFAVMSVDPRNAAVFGLRRDVYPESRSDFSSQGPRPEEYGLGGNGLYRKSVLDQVGGFNPFLISEEEGELRGRIEQAGYRAISTGTVMFEHHTEPRDTVREFRRRMRSGLAGGPGPVLRLAARTKRLGYHARRYNRYLLTLAYLIVGAIALPAALLTGYASIFLGWVGAGLAALTALSWKRGSIRGAVFIVGDWVSVALNMVPGLIRPSRDPDSFAPHIKVIRSASGHQNRS